ncbi:hypothetical protein TSAR_013670, partial [Trichomalopsis sarcophagae]
VITKLLFYDKLHKSIYSLTTYIPRTLELFVHSLLTKTMQITSAKQAKTLSPSHMKQCILSESRFDFLKDLVKNLPDASGPDDDNHTPPATPAMQVVPASTAITSFAPKAPAVAVVNVSKDGSTCVQPFEQTQIPSRRHSVDKGDRGAKTVFACNAPKFKISVPTSFNASQPNFYTEVNSSASDSVPRSSAVNQPVSNFACTANIDEDYDT